MVPTGLTFDEYIQLKVKPRAGADVVVDARDTIQIVIGVGVAGIGIVSAKPRRLTQINDTVMRYLE